MQSKNLSPLWPAWVVLALVIGGVILKFALDGSKKSASDTLALAGIGEFELSNQFGDLVSEKDLAGKLWIADVMFTRCPGPCLAMTRQLAALRAELPDDGSIGFLSFTSDPDYDSPEVLKEYYDLHGGDGPPWHFLTGPKDELYDLIRGALKLALMEKPEEERESEHDLVIHSTLFLLLDGEGRLIEHFYGADEHDPVAMLAAVKKNLEGR